MEKKTPNVNTHGGAQQTDTISKEEKAALKAQRKAEFVSIYNLKLFFFLLNLNSIINSYFHFFNS